jgi:predicted 2-oxoglutarate/Fe(II)-dependent dioxygenase YbiX
MKYEILHNAVLFRSVLTNIPAFIDNQLEKQFIGSEISRGSNAAIDTGFRYSEQTNVNANNPIVEKIREVVKFANASFFKINISNYCKENHFLRYDLGGKFEAHTDTIWPADVNNLDKKPVRKLTAISLLNDQFTGGKLALWYTNKRYSFSFNPGDVLIFPSYVKHKVDPIESGIRYSLVSWSYGEF